jgi:peptidoglycan/LPS O-acetylase OafA/YrhL
MTLPRSTAAAAPTPGRRLTELDALRGIAALAVVGFHYLYAYPTEFDPGAPVVGPAEFGKNGVLLFFMISGFVIYMTVAQAPRAWTFVTGRVSRLYPAYWVAVLATFLLISVAPMPGQRATPTQTLVNLTMFEGVFMRVPYLDEVYWTLTIELMFYVLVALLLVVKRPQWTLAALWVAAGVYLVGRYAWSMHPENRLLAGLFDQLTLLWFANLFAAGIIFYLIIVQGRRSPFLYAQLALVPIVDALAHGLISGLVIASMVGVMATSLVFRPAFLRARPVLFFGAISYSLYLVHLNMGYVTIRWLDQAGVNHWASVALAFGLAVGVATALNRLVERPAHAALGRWFARRSARAVSTVAGPVPGSAT